MRGRPFVVVELWFTFMITTYHVITSRVPLAMLLFQTCQLHATICQDPGYAVTYPDYYYSLDMTCCLLSITILSCYLLTPSMIHRFL